nr:MATE family efflux transporter [Blautia argi]
MEEHDFSRGSMLGNIFRLSLPLILAQFINVLYNIVDRVYIGRIPGASSAALTGVGVAFPVITAIMAFSFLIGTGGAPLCSIERGRGNAEKAKVIMGNSFLMTLVLGIVLTVMGFFVKEPLLYALGASKDTFGYANDYLGIYLLGTVFVMITMSMNGFINCQGFARTGMCTVLIGAVINLILDPVFIFGFHMGVKGAAVATVISQAVSALWVVSFLRGKENSFKAAEAVYEAKAFLYEGNSGSWAFWFYYGSNQLRGTGGM